MNLQRQVVVTRRDWSVRYEPADGLKYNSTKVL